MEKFTISFEFTVREATTDSPHGEKFELIDADGMRIAFVHDEDQARDIAFNNMTEGTGIFTAEVS